MPSQHASSAWVARDGGIVCTEQAHGLAHCMRVACKVRSDTHEGTHVGLIYTGRSDRVRGISNAHRQVRLAQLVVGGWAVLTRTWLGACLGQAMVAPQQFFYLFKSF